MIELVKLPRGNFDYLIDIVDLRGSGDCASDVLSEEDMKDLCNYIALHPECGEVLPRTGGIRKLRWTSGQSGRNRLRIVYLFHDLNMPVYLLAAYGPGQVLRIGKREELLMASLVETITREQIAGRILGQMQGTPA